MPRAAVPRRPSGPSLRAGATYPSREDFLGLVRQGNLVPIVREILADLETPVSAFVKLVGAATHDAAVEGWELVEVRCAVCRQQRFERRERTFVGGYSGWR